MGHASLRRLGRLLWLCESETTESLLTCCLLLAYARATERDYRARLVRLVLVVCVWVLERIMEKRLTTGYASVGISEYSSP